MTDYERGVEQASAIYKEVIRDYVAENAKLRELVIRMRPICMQGKRCTFADKLYIMKAMEELGIEVDG